MKKICLIGDSHLACLQTAISGSDIREKNELTFFGCHANLVSGLVLSGRKLVSINAELAGKLKQFSAGKDQVDIDGYDRFVIIGHGFWMGTVVGRYRHYVSDSMPGTTMGKYLLSDECFVTVSEQICRRSEALRLAVAIRSVSDKPITVVPNPNPGFGLSEENMAAWYPPCHAAVHNGDDKALSTLFLEVCARLAKKNQIDVIPPIAEAALNGVFNQSQYSLLPEETRPGYLMHAMVHGSASYGALLARYIFG
jgi:hypothetical protein